MFFDFSEVFGPAQMCSDANGLVQLSLKALKFFQFFSKFENEINILCVEGGYKREDAVKLHLKKSWKRNKLHDRHEMTDPEGRRVRFDIWLLSAATVTSILSEKVRAYLGEHGFAFAVVSTAIILLTAKNKLSIRIRQCTASIRDRMRQRAGVIETGRTLRDRFEVELKKYLSHIKFDGNIVQGEL